MNDKKVFMVHGFRGEPNGGWRPWLMGQLAKADVYACALPMPTPSDPIKEEWIKEIQHAIPNPNEDIFLVGHSLGVPAILNYLESLPEGAKIGGAVLVSGPIEKIDTENPDSKLRKIDHFFHDFDFNKIKNSCLQFSVIHGDNDPKVVFENHAIPLSEKLSCELISIPNGGHLNGNSGWYELPEAFTALMHFLTPNT